MQEYRRLVAEQSRSDDPDDAPQHETTIEVAGSALERGESTGAVTVDRAPHPGTMRRC